MFYQLFYHMEECSLLDPSNEIHIFALHYVYLPRINRHLRIFSSGHNNGLLQLRRSNHRVVQELSSVITKQADTLKITSYAHLFNSCSQDWFAVLSILENLLSVIKSSNPGITKGYFRSDEVGCYHNSCLVSSLRDLGKRQGIEVLRYDHSEPQYGKDVCNRILCPMKAAIRCYCTEGNDVITAEDMHVALMKRQVRGTTAAVCCVNEDSRTLKINKIPNYSSLHNF